MWPNFQSSLSQNRIDVLRKANEVIEGDEYFKFAYAYMHDNFKFILNKLSMENMSWNSEAKKTLLMLYLSTL